MPGKFERARECGVKIESSENLLQPFMRWSEEDRAAHLDTIPGVMRAKAAGVALIDARLRAREPITELEGQAVSVRELAKAGLEKARGARGARPRD